MENIAQSATPQHSIKSKAVTIPLLNVILLFASIL